MAPTTNPPSTVPTIPNRSKGKTPNNSSSNFKRKIRFLKSLKNRYLSRIVIQSHGKRKKSMRFLRSWKNETKL